VRSSCSPIQLPYHPALLPLQIRKLTLLQDEHVQHGGFESQLANVPRYSLIREIVLAGCHANGHLPFPQKSPNELCLELLLNLNRAFLLHAVCSCEDPGLMKLHHVTSLTLDVSGWMECCVCVSALLGQPPWVHVS